MIIINDAPGSKAHHRGVDDSNLGIVICAKIRTGKVDKLLLGTY